MRALSTWQPHASLWLTPAKIHETRSWKTDYRGPLLVHAAKRRESIDDPKLRRVLQEQFGKHWEVTFAYGALIGQVEIIDMVSSDVWSPTPLSREDVCGNWTSGRWGWMRSANVVIFDKPIPYIGRQGLFNVPDDVFREAA